MEGDNTDSSTTITDTSDMIQVVLLGTCDTKFDELSFLQHEIRKAPGVNVTLIDVGRSPRFSFNIGITQKKLLEDYGNGADVSKLERGEVIKAMAAAATKCVKKMYGEGKINAIISAGGSGGTALAAEVFRNALPIGFPKLIVSTIASGDTSSIIEETDITLMNSVVDVAGLNGILRQVLKNAGAAIAGMAGAYRYEPSEHLSKKVVKKRVGITMFGVTTPAVDTIRKHLEFNYEIETYIFHATGHGGKAMERLVRENGLDAVLDLTTTEICDHVTGGVMSAGQNRLEAAAEAGIPNIISVGATDMSNFGPIKDVPERYKERKLYEHNPVVTLMRTSKDEARQIGEYIVEKLKSHSQNPKVTQVWLPRGGISMISVPDGPFADKDTDEVLFRTIRDGLANSEIEVIVDDRAINEDTFALDIAEALIKKMQIARKMQ